MRRTLPPSIFASRSSLGAVPIYQGRREASYTARSVRQLPSLIFISDGKMHDVKILDQLVPEVGECM